MVVNGHLVISVWFNGKYFKYELSIPPRGTCILTCNLNHTQGFLAKYEQTPDRQVYQTYWKRDKTNIFFLKIF